MKYLTQSLNIIKKIFSPKRFGIPRMHILSIVGYKIGVHFIVDFPRKDGNEIY